MAFVYKVSKKNIKLDINVENIYICSPCYKYIKLKELKLFLRESKSPNLYIRRNPDNCSDVYKTPFEYTKCYTCNRFVSNILNGPDIIKFIEQSIKDDKPENLMLSQISKLSNWMYHDLIDYFNPDLITKFKLDRGQFKNINQAINDLNGLPLENDIISRSEDLFNYITHEIKGYVNI